MLKEFVDLAQRARERLNQARTDALAAQDFLSPRVREDNPDILGRDGLSDKIAAEFAATPGPIALIGQGGIGKTAAADHYARTRFRSGHYHGVWRISGEGISQAASDLNPLGKQLGVADTNDAMAYYRAVTTAIRAQADHPKRWLLIHDNVDDEATQRALAERLTDVAQIDHLITSRLRDWSPRATSIRVPEPGPADAVALLAREAGRDADPDLAQLAVETLGGLPLALVLVGAHLRNSGVTVTEYGESFADALKMKPAGTNAYSNSLAEAVARSVAELDDNARAMLALAAFMAPEDIDPDYLEKGAAGLLPENDYFELSQHKVRRRTAISDLEKHSLLRKVEVDGAAGPEHSYRVHRLTQLVLRDGMDQEMTQALIGTAAAVGVAQVTTQIQFDVKSWPRYRRLFRQTVTLAPMLSTAAVPVQKAGGNFVNSAALFLREANGDLNGARQLYEQNLSIVANAFGSESLNFGVALGCLGAVLDHLARIETDPAARLALDEQAERHLKEARRVKRAATDDDGVGVAFDEARLGGFYWARKRFDAAEPHYHAALHMVESGEAAPELIGASHGNLGVLYNNWADSLDRVAGQEMREKAEQHNEEALHLTRKGLGEIHFDTATRLNNLALSRLRSGKTGEACRLMVRAAAIPFAMARNALISVDHPVANRGISALGYVLSLIKDPSDPLTLAEAEVPAVLADHAAWERGETPGWPV